MAVSYDDGVSYVECDECGCEIRKAPVTQGMKVYHGACAPQ